MNPLTPPPAAEQPEIGAAGDWADTKAAWSLFGDGLDAALAFFRRDGMCEFSTPSYDALYARQAAAAGPASPKLAGQSLRSIVGEDAWPAVAREVSRALSGNACVYESRLETPMGDRWLEVRLLPNRLRGHLNGYWSVVFDVNERAMQERLIEAAWHRLEQFSQATSEGIAFYENGVLVDCNEALSRLLGRPRETLIGLSVLSFFPGQDQGLANRHIRLGRDTPYPAILTRPDGTKVEVEISGRQANWRSSDLYVATVRDVSKLNRVSESLIRSQARYRALVEHAVEAILFAQKARVVYANPAACQLFGLSSQEIVGTRILALAHPDQRAALSASPSFREPQTEAIDVKVLCPPAPLEPRKRREPGDPSEPLDLPSHDAALQDSSGVVKWVRASGVGVDWDGSPASMIFMTDITVERESKEQLLRALQQERDLGQLRTRFVSMASHEFRTPLATIQTSTEILQHYHARLSDDQREETVADILKSVQRMQAMIDNFLMLGRMQADAMKCEPRALALVDVLQHITHECAIADDHQHLVVLDVQPAIGMHPRLMLDEMLLRLIVGNLLGNACKYSEAGRTVWLRVRRRQVSEMDCLCLSVADQGIGIPQADLPRLFEAFYRASNAGEVRGTGVGLAIVKRAVQSHGGTIEVQTDQGQGSTFTVSLPWQAP